jgi:hypothetical protein
MSRKTDPRSMLSPNATHWVARRLNTTEVTKTARIIPVPKKRMPSYIDAMQRAAWNYWTDTAAATGNQLREQMTTVKDAAATLQLALDACDETARAAFMKFWRQHHDQNSDTWRGICEAVMAVRMNAAIIAEKPRCWTRKTDTPAGTKTEKVQWGIPAKGLPGVVSERARGHGLALPRLGESLARIHAAHSKSGDFILGKEQPSKSEWLFYSDDFEWFKAAIALIDPDLSKAEISRAAKRGRASLHTANKGADT